MTDSPKLSGPARAAIAAASVVQVSPITYFEIGQKVRIGKWTEKEQYLATLAERLMDQSGLSAPSTNDIALLSTTLDWHQHDPLDRILATTAMANGIALISGDAAFDNLQDPRIRVAW